MDNMERLVEVRKRGKYAELSYSYFVPLLHEKIQELESRIMGEVNDRVDPMTLTVLNAKLTMLMELRQQIETDIKRGSNLPKELK